MKTFHQINLVFSTVTILLCGGCLYKDGGDGSGGYFGARDAIKPEVASVGQPPMPPGARFFTATTEPAGAQPSEAPEVSVVNSSTPMPIKTIRIRLKMDGYTVETATNIGGPFSSNSYVSFPLGLSVNCQVTGDLSQGFLHRGGRE